MDYYSMMELGETLDQKFDELVENCMLSGEIDQNLYQKYDVKRGLRDANGKGVLTGLTEISDVVAVRKDENGVSHPIDGELYFQGINVNDLINGNQKKHFMFEETTYLLLFGKLYPDSCKSQRIVRTVCAGCDSESSASQSDECIAEMYRFALFL